jgi:hypothetical protein
MFRRGTFVRIGAAAVAAATVGTAAAGTAAAGVHPATGHAPRTQAVTVRLWLSPKFAAAERFATAVSTPGSR